MDNKTERYILLFGGIVSLVFGVLLFTQTTATLALIMLLVGLSWFIQGIVTLASIFIDKADWGWKLVGGILGILAGLIVLQHPLWSPLVIGATLIIILGVQGLIVGVIGLVQAFRGAGWGAGIIGAVSILIGLLLLFNVGGFTLALPWTIGLLALVGGVLSTIAAFRLR